MKAHYMANTVKLTVTPIGILPKHGKDHKGNADRITNKQQVQTNEALRPFPTYRKNRHASLLQRLPSVCHNARKFTLK